VLKRLPLAALFLLLPGTAHAAEFKDRVITRPMARISQADGPTAQYLSGTTPITITGDPTIAQNYANFLSTLPHGAELADLRVVIVPAAQVNSACGGEDGDGILACYGSDDQTMIVPDQQQASDIPVDYVIAHEYGHHIAEHRSNAPLAAIDYGPKRWSSYELVCDKTSDGKLAPGDEGDAYAYNPGEAWAETYARLVYPGEAWRLAPILAPDKGSYLSAAADVLTPWTQRTSTTFSGSGTQTFKLPITLDGRFTLSSSRKPKEVLIRSGGKLVDKIKGRKRINYSIACRSKQSETLNITVKTTGSYSLKASYAG
jgi:hypothetical protein